MLVFIVYGVTKYIVNFTQVITTNTNSKQQQERCKVQIKNNQKTTCRIEKINNENYWCIQMWFQEKSKTFPKISGTVNQVHDKRL